MKISVSPVEFQDIAALRDLYRKEMNCQIVHDSSAGRPGCTQSYGMNIDNQLVGHGCVWIGEFWLKKGTVFEFFVLTLYRQFTSALFREFISITRASYIQAQSNDPLLNPLLQEFTDEIVETHILFQDGLVTNLSLEGVLLRRTVPEDTPRIFDHQVEPIGDWLLESDGVIVATGGILYHYNRPYGDIFMEVAPAFRKRGFGSYLVQELKRICYEGGSVPAARTKPTNEASRLTLLKSGFVPCGRILNGSISR